MYTILNYIRVQSSPSHRNLTQNMMSCDQKLENANYGEVFGLFGCRLNGKHLNGVSVEAIAADADVDVDDETFFYEAGKSFNM